MTDTWKLTMEKVALETQEAYAVHKRDRKNYWHDIHPRIKDLPPGWPGDGLDHGLCNEHVIPN